MAEHRSRYDRRDLRVVDYHDFKLPGTGLWFRGPPPAELAHGGYLVCLGAAQTYGCFCQRPFPVLLRERLGLGMLNLGYGGAGPSFFLKHEALIERVNRGRLAIVQVMSARSESNACFDTGGLEYLTRRTDGARVAAASAYRDLLRQYCLGRLAVGPFEAFVFAGRSDGVAQLVAETRSAWVDRTCALLARIEVPKILLYFSTRSPAYRERYATLSRLFGPFPQLVKETMVEQVKAYADAHVACVSRRGVPQRLVDRFTGRPTTVDLSDDRSDLKGIWTHNRYYPSPEMHEDAADALEPVCRELLAREVLPRRQSSLSSP